MGETVEILEFPNEWEGQETRWFNISISPLKENGRTYAAIALSNEITEHVRQRNVGEDARSKTQLRYDFLGKVLSSLDILLNVFAYPSMKLVWSNDTHRVCRSFTPEPDSLEYRQRLAMGRLAGESRVTQVLEPIMYKDSSYRKVIYTPLTDEVDDVSHIGQLSVDITSLVQAQKEIEELMDSKDEFLSIFPMKLELPQPPF